MTIMVYKVNGDSFIFIRLTYDSATQIFDVKTEAFETGKQTIFKCLEGAKHYSFIEGLHKNLPPAEKKARIESSEQL